MPASIKPVLLVPVYNHGATLRQVLLDALCYHPDILVVDDGCTDNGCEAIQELPIHLLRLEKNMGKGVAIRSGASQARYLGYTHIITLDADGQHQAKDIPAFLAAVDRAPNSLVVGVRDFTVPHVPGSSKFGRKFSQFWMFVQTGVNVHDMQSGFRAYPLSLLEAVRCSEAGYAFEIEILVRSAWAGFSIQEIPISVFYPPKGQRVSHFKSFADNIRISLLNTRLTVRAFIPVPFNRKALATEGELSLRHPLRTLQRLLEGKSTPKELGRSAAWSIFLSTLPLLGIQTLLLLFFINWKRLNRLCALVMIPLTWPPFVPGLAVLLGYRITHGKWLTEFSLKTLGHEAGYRFLDWMAGSLVLAPILGASGGCLIYVAAKLCASGRR